MALIDTFLKLMLEKRAERLVMVSDTVPYLLKGADHIELSMPSLRTDMLRRMAFEIMGTELPKDGEPAQREGSFLSTEGTSFGYHIGLEGNECRIGVHALSALPPEELAPGLDLLERMAAGEMPVAAAPVRAARPRSTVTEPAMPAPVSRSSASAGMIPDLLATIDQAVAMEVSDIFFSSGKPPRVRRNGLVARLDAPDPTEEEILQLLPNESARQELEERGSTDFGVRWELSGGPCRMRINVFRHLHGVAAAIRPIRLRIPGLAELNLPESLLELVGYPSGLVLISGTSGSGKSTTMSALIDHLNRTRSLHVITIEDPVEFEHREIQSLIHQREVGANVESFSDGLRSALRENPDVILLGELRDLATISAALTAAETGHLVLGTIHCGNASAAINRIVDVFPGHQQAFIRTQLSGSLRAVLSQRLVPSRGGRGLIPAIEKLVVTPAVANGIREGHDHHIRNAMLTGSEDGMITLERSLATMVRRGLIDRETALRSAIDQKTLLHQLE